MPHSGPGLDKALQQWMQAAERPVKTCPKGFGGYDTTGLSAHEKLNTVRSMGQINEVDHDLFLYACSAHEPVVQDRNEAALLDFAGARRENLRACGSWEPGESCSRRLLVG